MILSTEKNPRVLREGIVSDTSSLVRKLSDLDIEFFSGTKFPHDSSSVVSGLLSQDSMYVGRLERYHIPSSRDWLAVSSYDGEVSLRLSELELFSHVGRANYTHFLLKQYRMPCYNNENDSAERAQELSYFRNFYSQLGLVLDDHIQFHQ